MLNKEILKEYIKSGCSLDKQLNNIKQTSGYIVSLMGYEKTYNINDIDGVYNQILEYQKIIKNNQYIGIWVHDNTIYCDISVHYNKKQDAVITGVKNRQLAIYDLKNNKDIDLLKTTYIVYQYNKIKNDVKYIKEYYDIKDIVKDYKLTKNKSVQNYIYKDIDNIDIDNIHLLNDKYIIFKDTMYLRDYYDIIEA